MKPNGRVILKLHSGFLMTLTPVLTAAAYVGLFAGIGPYGGFSDNPMAIVGLAQAYPLMGLVAVMMWRGASSTSPGVSSVVAIAAHCVPLSALAILWDPIMASSIAPAVPLSFLIHGGGIASEFFSLRIGYGQSGRTCDR
jgi:hypothetical protein